MPIIIMTDECFIVNNVSIYYIQELCNLITQMIICESLGFQFAYSNVYQKLSFYGKKNVKTCKIKKRLHPFQG